MIRNRRLLSLPRITQTDTDTDTGRQQPIVLLLHGSVVMIYGVVCPELTMLILIPTLSKTGRGGHAPWRTRVKTSQSLTCP